MKLERDDRRDRELLERLAAGDREALGEIYDVHAESLFRYACALTRHPADAEDIVQAVFVKLATTGPVLLGVRKPASYLHRMLRFAWIDLARRRSLNREEPMAGDLAYPADDGAVAGIDVRRALDSLPVEQREAVLLHLFGGFSLRETGRITGVSMFTAASRYRLALARLRRLLGEG